MVTILNYIYHFISENINCPLLNDSCPLKIYFNITSKPNPPLPFNLMRKVDLVNFSKDDLC